MIDLIIFMFSAVLTAQHDIIMTLKACYVNRKKTSNFPEDFRHKTVQNISFAIHAWSGSGCISRPGLLPALSRVIMNGEARDDQKISDNRNLTTREMKQAGSSVILRISVA